jgi:hypothetical protein
MKKLFATLTLIIIFSGTVAYAQNAVNIDRAIREVADYLDTTLPAGSVVAVLNIKSDNQVLSKYIIDEIVKNIVDRKNFTVAERHDLDMIHDELAFQLSGDVSDESAQAIGNMLGAQIIISGEFSAVNRLYRLGIKAVTVGTAAIAGRVNKDISADRKLRTLIGDTGNFPVSIGGGFRVGGTFATGTLERSGMETAPSVGSYLYNYTSTEKNHRDQVDMGGFLFFDLKYVEINASLYHSLGRLRWSWNKEYSYNNQIVHTEKDSRNNGDSSITSFHIGILGKYPFYFNNATLFPAIGADYQLWLYHAEKGKRITGDLSRNNSIWLRVGGGIDYNLTRSLFIRGELLWGAKLPSVNESKDSFTYFTHSPTINIGIGYILNQR